MNFLKKISIFSLINISLIAHEFPRALSSYNDTHFTKISDILLNRIKLEPFNLVTTIIFILAIIHSFLSSYLLKLAHKIEEDHREKIKRGEKTNGDIKMLAKLLHFVGEIETVFGLWTKSLAFYQNRIDLKLALLVAFFLAGLIILGGVQSWWIAPVLGNLSKYPLMISSIVLTSFNDNAAITYLASLVENFSESNRYIIVAGAITGGGLTIIANAPNPAGQSILKRYFPKGISAIDLFKAAFIPTLIFAFIFIIFGIIV